jgi:hypothetical protein
MWRKGLRKAPARGCNCLLGGQALCLKTKRNRRVEELAKNTGSGFLVATDCLSEGINLQETLHSGRPTMTCLGTQNRLEQRDGRVDRFRATCRESQERFCFTVAITQLMESFFEGFC